MVQIETIEFSQGPVTWTSAVQVTWLPGPSPAFGYAAIAVQTATLTCTGLLLLRRYERLGTVQFAVAALLGLLVVTDALHLVGIAFGVKGTTGAALSRVFSVGFASVAAWLIGLVAIFLLIRHRVDGFYLATFAAGLMTLVGGLADVGVLSHSSIPFAFGVTVARISVVLTFGLGIGIAVISVLATRPDPSAAEVPQEFT